MIITKESITEPVVHSIPLENRLWALPKEEFFRRTNESRARNERLSQKEISTLDCVKTRSAYADERTSSAFGQKRSRIRRLRLRDGATITFKITLK